MRNKRLCIFGLLFLIVGIVLMGTFLLDTAEGLARIKKEDECVAHFLKKAKQWKQYRRQNRMSRGIRYRRK